MTSPQWQRVDGLLDAVMDLPPLERAAFLDRECNGDNALRREVESLLAAHDQASGFFDSQPAAIADDLIRDRQAEALVGHAIGQHRIVREIGRGGMGVVARKTYGALNSFTYFGMLIAIARYMPCVTNLESTHLLASNKMVVALAAKIHSPARSETFR